MKTSFKVLLVLASFGFSACAEKRPVEKLKDPDKTNLSKEVFVGGSSAKGMFPSSAGGNNKIWFAKVTIVKNTPNGGPNFIGLQSDMKMGAFRFTQNQLQFVSVVTPYENPGSALNELVTAWPVEHFDKKLVETDGKVTNKEAEDTDKKWENKRFVKIKLEAPVNGEQAFFPSSSRSEMSCYVPVSSNLVDGSKEITETSINFVVETHYQVNPGCANIRRWNRGDFTYSAQYKYSFRQVQPEELTNYKPYVYKGEGDPLVSKYGYFKTVLEKFNSEGREENIFMMNRWHPNKKHTFYFAEDFPQEFKWMFTDPKIGIAKKTNDVFEQNGLDIRIEIKDGDGSQKFGDIRYSFIKFIQEVDTTAPLGYGPSDANPLTGEIVSANLMVWTSSLKYYVRIINDEVKRLPTKFENASIFQKMKLALKEEDQTKWTAKSSLLAPDTKTGQAYDLLITQLLNSHPGYNPFTSGFDASKFDKSLDLTSTLDALEGMSPLNRKHFAKAVEESASLAKDHLRKTLGRPTDQYNSTIFNMDDVLGDVRHMLVDGKTPQQVIDSILYSVSIHELGHNLNLRHNFFGSVDKKNFAHSHPAIDKSGEPILKKNEEGALVPVMTVPMTASVMDYLQVRDEVHADFDWGAYDKAALVYAYSSGDIDLGKKNGTRYLYCTDEHVPLNSICNRFDRGTTPSEILMSIVETYEDRYWSNNYRYDRAYWDVGGYEGRILQTMWDVKRFLLFMQTNMVGNDIRDILVKTEKYSDEEITEVTSDLGQEMLQSIRISLAFFDSVLKQSAADRDWNDEIDPRTGALKKLGIASDKMWAMIFLMGDDGFLNNPNRNISKASYLTLHGHPQINEMFDEILSSLITDRVDMEVGFINFARSLYAQNSSNYLNRGNTKLLEKIRVACMRKATLKSQLGIDADKFSARPSDPVEPLIVATTVLKGDESSPYFGGATDRVGIADLGNGNYFVASETKNSYAFRTFEIMEDAFENESNLVQSKDDLRDMRQLYLALSGEDRDCE